jgi:small subunit ribosomal protein S6
MNNYETVFIATPVLSDAQTKELLGKFQGVITENGGQIINSEDWGLKKLEYPIQKKSTGFYFLIEFTGEGNIIETLETQYRRDERVIRFLTFRQDKHAVEYSAKRRAKLAGRTNENATTNATKTAAVDADETINAEEE